MNTESPLAAPREPVSAPSPLKESLVAGETGGTFDSEEVPAAAAGDTRPHMRPDIEKFGKGLLICVAYAASIGGISTLTGTPTNLVFTGDLDDFFRSGEQSRMLFDAPGSGGPVSFAKWMAFALPLSSTLLVIMWIVLFKMFGSQSLPTLPEEAVQRQYAALGPMRFGEGMVLAHFLVLALLWISQSFWSELFIYDGQKMVTSATPAVTIAVALFMAPAEPLGSRPGQPLRRCLDWKTAVTLPWGVVLLIGGGFALADGVNRSGLADWLGDQLLFLQSWPAVLVLLVVNFFMTFMTEFCSNVSTCTVMLPILKTIASIMKVHPYFLLIPGTISTSFAFMLPIATPPNAIAFSGGELVVMDMARPGLVANLLGICLTTVFT
jgi:sodium-dependent dicarboxylate transporter 2/3/5